MVLERSPAAIFSADTEGRKSGYFKNLMRPSVKNHVVASLGEFMGTVLFLFFAFGGTQVANSKESLDSSSIGATTNHSALLYIALSFGFSLAVNAWVFFRISGGLFNPAITLGMVLVGGLHPLRALFTALAQLGGGIVAAVLIKYLLPGDFSVQTVLTPGVSVVRGLFIEMVCTSMLLFTILMLAAEKHKATFIAPVGIGLAMFICELVGVFYTGGSLNPIRSFGPAVVEYNFVHYHWIYWVGPIMGALFASGFYKLMKILEYETANPDQDADDGDQSVRASIQRLSQAGLQLGLFSPPAGNNDFINTMEHGEAQDYFPYEGEVMWDQGSALGGPAGTEITAVEEHQDGSQQAALASLEKRNSQNTLTASSIMGPKAGPRRSPSFVTGPPGVIRSASALAKRRSGSIGPNTQRRSVSFVRSANEQEEIISVHTPNK